MKCMRFFLKREAGNYSVESGSDGAILVIIHVTSPEPVRPVELGERCTCNDQNRFESQCIYEYDADGGFFLEKWNPRHLMVDTYSHSHEVDEVVIGSVHSRAFTCTSDDTLTFTLSNSGVVRNQPIVPPESSAEDRVNFADYIDFASFYEPENYLTATTFRYIS